jgi:hypothetical protein
VFDNSYVIEVCSRFFNNLLLSDISREEWKTLCENIWLSFYRTDISSVFSENTDKVASTTTTTTTKSKAK